MFGIGTQGRFAPLRRVFTILALAICLLVPTVSAQAVEMRQGWWLQIKNAACVHGPMVLLGDIATPQGDMPASAWQALASRPLWNAPERTGRQMALSRDKLLAMLRYYAEDIAGACALPTQLVVQRGGKVIDGADIMQHVVDFLTARGPAFSGELDIKDLHGPDYIFLSNERDQLAVLPSSPLKPGRVNLLFEMRGSDGKVIRRYSASAFVNVWRALPVLARPLNRQEPLNLSYVKFKRCNLAFNENSWDGTGGPWRMVRGVGVDQVIRMSDIEPVPVIARGDKVNLVFEGDNIRLQVKAEALADGGIGQRIEVRNLQSKRKIMATVQDQDTVLVR
ncbi:MAG: flagellar basal body P-ring formation chaperone FlgA [Humidesulfovibrio sp.]|nr:flagellar basal body P-ring formation chaperone FlgA [Humidesulfovibrio sp.]